MSWGSTKSLFVFRDQVAPLDIMEGAYLACLELKGHNLGGGPGKCCCEPGWVHMRTYEAFMALLAALWPSDTSII